MSLKSSISCYIFYPLANDISMARHLLRDNRSVRHRDSCVHDIRLGRAAALEQRTRAEGGQPRGETAQEPD